MQGAEFGLRLLAGLVCPSLAEQSAAVTRFMVDERRTLIGGCTQRWGEVSAALSPWQREEKTGAFSKE